MIRPHHSSGAISSGNGAQDERVRYVAAVLLGRPLAGFTWPEWLAYGPAGRGHRGVTIVSSEFFGQDYGTQSSLPSLPLHKLDGIPILFGEPDIAPCGAELVVHADILASAFFLLTRYEEWVRKDVRDAHGRFPGRESIACRAGFIDRPVVDEYAELLRGWAAEVGAPLPPPDRKFQVLLTHDVDHLGPELGPESALRQIAAGTLLRKPWKAAFEEAGGALGLARHRFNNLEEVLHLDDSFAQRVAPDCCQIIYFFMTGGASPHDPGYKPHASLLRQAIRRVMATGADVGLHASYSAGGDPSLIVEERAALEAVTQVPITKNRHHFLRWGEPQQGWDIAAGGIKWDSTLGFADVAGFRLGVCRPVPLFDPVACAWFGIEEHPLVVMDCSLFFPQYMGLDEEQAFGYVRRLADATRRHRGEFILNWHNTSLCAREPGYGRSLYLRTLDYLASIAKS